MRLSNEQFKRFQELGAKIKAKKATPAEEKEFAELQALKRQGPSNDLAWWNNYPELLKNVVNLPFNWIPGTRVSLTGQGASNVPLHIGAVAMAKLVTAIGRCTSDADAFNTQIRQLWVDMHRKYRGIGAYQKADLGIMLLAVNSFFETLAKFERIYGVINTYHIGNRVVPYGLMEALGISRSLEENLADFRYTLNLYIEKCKQLCLPKGLSILTSDTVAIANLFKDSKDRRAYIFGYDSDSFGYFDGSMVNTGGAAIGSAVKFEDFSERFMTGVTPGQNAAFTLADIRNILEVQVSALMSDDDIQIMCSDLLAAYGPENVLTLLPVPEDYRVEPVEDYERSLQFHNLTIVDGVATIYDETVIDVTLAQSLYNQGISIVVYQKDNIVQYRVGKCDYDQYVSVSGEAWPTGANTPDAITKGGEILFDTWVDQPGDAEIMCGTRYTALGGVRVPIIGGGVREEIFSYGSKLVQRLNVYYFDYSTATYNEINFYGNHVDSAKFAAHYHDYLMLLQMDWAPIFYVYDTNRNDYTIFGDLDNFTKISSDNLDRIHEVALLSGYKIPMVSKD